MHPETLKKLRQELEDANLSRPYPKWKEVRDLPYLDVCVQEGARIHPPFALPLERIVPAGGIDLLGRYLPEGTLVGGNPYVVNRHESLFGPRPEEWDPERWLRDGESHKKKLERSILTVSISKSDHSIAMTDYQTSLVLGDAYALGSILVFLK